MRLQLAGAATEAVLTLVDGAGVAAGLMTIAASLGARRTGAVGIFAWLAWIVAASLGEADLPILAGFHEDIPNGARLK